jgi:hypothetical protein
MTYEGPNSYQYIAASALIKTGRGTLVRLIVGATSTATTVQVYDNTAASGTVIHQALYQAAVAQEVWSIEVGCRFETGLYIKLTGGTGLVTAIYQ